MRIAFIADIHGNLPALQAVIEDTRMRGVGYIVCLGDIVGYGPQPVECLHLVQNVAAASVIGNHDAAVCGRLSLDCFNDFARATAQRAAMALSDEDKAWLAERPYTLQSDDFACAHGSFDHPENFPYLDDKITAEKALQACPGIPLLIVGHTHIPCSFVRDTPTSPVRKYPPVDFVLKPGMRCVLNPGSVGFPRGEQVAATYLLYDNVTQRLSYRVIRYDLARYRLALVQNSYNIRDYWFLGSGLTRSLPGPTFADTPAAPSAPPIGAGGTFRRRSDERPEIPKGFWFLVALLIALILALTVALMRVSDSVENVEAVEARAVAALTANHTQAHLPVADRAAKTAPTSPSLTAATPLLPSLAEWALPNVPGLRLRTINKGKDLCVLPDASSIGPMPRLEFESPIRPIPPGVNQLNVRFAAEAVRSAALRYACRVRYYRADGKMRNDAIHSYKTPGRRSYTSDIPVGCTSFSLSYIISPAGSFSLVAPQAYPIMDSPKH